MYTNFDYEEERQSEEDRLNQFFGEFSSEARLKLMSKNLVKPQSLYDIFYPSIKNDLIVKNVNLFNTDLDEFSKEIRNNQLAKAIEKATSLEEQSEDFRNSMVARNKLHEDVDQLLDLSEQKRKDLLSKNTSFSTDLLVDSEDKRNSSLSKNKENLNFEKQINENQDKYRIENLSKNPTKEQDLEKDSDAFRKDGLAKNTVVESDLETFSENFRNNDLSKNKSSDSDIEVDSNDFRKTNLSQNTSKESDLETFSENFRENDLSKNITKETELEKDSVDFRNAGLSKNDSKATDLEVDSDKIRKDGLAKNDSKATDLEADSFNFREKNLATNNTNPTDLEDSSIDFRNSNLSSNNSIKSDLETDSTDFRNEDLLKNDSKQIDLETDSSDFRNSNLSNNDLKITDLIVDSEHFTEKNLAKNVEKTSNLEELSKDFRDTDLSNNVKKISDIQNDSDSYRNSNLAANDSVATNLETDSATFRNADLAANTPIVTDLETDSVAFRNADLAVNDPIVTDLETDSVPFRNNDLVANTPIVTDLESDSVSFRNNDLAANTPIVTDLETDSVSYVNNNLAANIPIATDLEGDSVPFRDNDLAANTPIVTDLEGDSIPFRDNDLAANTPIITDLETDSVPYRDGDLATNVPANINLEVDSIQYRNTDLASNVPSNQTLDSHVNQLGGISNPTAEKNNNLTKNVSTHQTIDSHYDQTGGMTSGGNERYLNLNRNIGFGPLGVNVMGFGTSVYLGVSAVWVQGLLFRNLLFLRNKYKAGGVLGASYSYYREADAPTEGLLRDTLRVPTMPEIKANKTLPMNPADTINNYVAVFSEITSPIERSLRRAYESTIAQKDSLKFYGITDKLMSVAYNIDYNLGNETIIGKNYGLKTTIETNLPAANINSLMRQYLKYSNTFALYDDGSLKETNTDNDIDKIYSTIWQITVGDERTKSIQNLIVSYKAFADDRRARIKRGTKSVTAPSGTYFKGNVENYFDEQYGNLDNTNIAAKTHAGNPFYDVEEGFNRRIKGVRDVLRRIGESPIALANNYASIQGQKGDASKSFVIGEKNRVAKKVYQKYTIANPYKATTAGKLLFYFKNYSIPPDQGSTMYFPAYIASFQNSDNASWNSTNFLGRPEAVYTYNNSSRDGSISFFVLSDYADRVLIGRKQDESQSDIFVDLKNGFIKPIQKINSLEADALQKSKEDDAKKIKNKQEEEKTNGSNPVGMAQNEGEADTLSKDGRVEMGTAPESADTNKKLADAKSEAGLAKNLADEFSTLLPQAKASDDTIYKESSNKVVNIYQSAMDGENDYDDGYIESKPSNTEKSIYEMFNGLMFQPAFFSGNLVDFKRKMEFLAKMTRPANNTSSDGFSFTKPPVCHMRLGDWFNHDIIVNSVSYDYSSAPWTLDDNGMNQPMWASVTVSFNIIGPAGESGGVPLTSTDREGYFGNKTIR